MERIFIVKITDDKKDIAYVSDCAAITKDIEKALAIPKKNYQLFKDSLKKFYNKDFLKKVNEKDYIDIEVELIEVSRDVYTRKPRGSNGDHWAKQYPIEDLISECKDTLRSARYELKEAEEVVDDLENQVYRLENELKELNLKIEKEN